MRTRFSFLLIIVFITALTALAQDEDVIRTSTENVVLNITVTDKAGQYVKGLKASDFKVYEDGVEVKPEMIASFSLHESPYAAVVLLDSSGSMEARFTLARSAAIKLVRPEAIASASARQSDAFVKRFRREAEAIASLQSPHTVYLYDFGLSEDGRLYYVMELLDGISLQTLVTNFGPQPASRVVSILSQACQSLDEAHARGLVHRDLKPSNLMICRVARTYDFVKVLDFGLAKSVGGQHDTQLTIAGTTTGTPGYMAPEVVMGDQAIDGRADLYALGCVAYLLLTGHQVFEDANATNLALQHVQAAPDPPSSRTELVIPPALERIILRCLAKRPAERPASAAVLLAALASIDIDAWDSETAAQWWEVHLPLSSSLRKAAQGVASDPKAVRKAPPR